MRQIQNIYSQKIIDHNSVLTKLRSNSVNLGLLRLISAALLLFSIYQYAQFDVKAYGYIAIVSMILFYFLFKKHQQIGKSIKQELELIRINEHELRALNGDLSCFENGKEFIDTSHPYSFDLDIFGQHSLFQYLNRTCTQIGKNKLADFLHRPKHTEIEANQAAIKELSNNIDWRQLYTALGKLNQDTQDSISNIASWTSSASFFNRSKNYLYLSFALPSITIICAGLYLFMDNQAYEYALSISFLVNLTFFGTLFKHIKKEYEQLNNSHKILLTYSQLIACIEGEIFQSDKLKTLQLRFKQDTTLASKSLENLSSILFKLDSMHYGLPTVLANGLFLYHIHCIYRLNAWKSRYGLQLTAWLDALSEVDALNSLANFSFNNPAFIFPQVSKEDVLIAEDLGHPLIAEQKRICNSIQFTEQKFTILTGSNMSGKSTFLRTIGLNLILAKTGAPVCAKQFVFYPYELFISMRIDDSLHNNESFFFAELTRLKNLIESLNQSPKTFILLDEILRGTNSNDKYNGTVGLIEKLIAQKAIGIIATHDLSVTDLSKKHPDYLNNKCFEVEIKNDELYFDYLLKEGVCEKMSASFLMKKLNII